MEVARPRAAQTSSPPPSSSSPSSPRAPVNAPTYLPSTGPSLTERPTIPATSSDSAASASATAAAGKAQGKREKAGFEPAFVSRKRPLTFDISHEEAEPVALKPSRWPLIFALVALFCVGGVAAAVIAKRSTGGASGAEARGAPDERHIAAASLDAGAVQPRAEPMDAGGAGGADAQTATAKNPNGRDRRPGVRVPRRQVDAGTRRPLRRREVKVITRPEDATLYIDQGYAGRDGTNLNRPEGAVVTVVCKKPGYRDGRVRIVFDSNTEIALCRLSRIAKCVDGIKNPFDDCPDE
jgi:hypothetical protein